MSATTIQLNLFKPPKTNKYPFRSRPWILLDGKPIQAEVIKYAFIDGLHMHQLEIPKLGGKSIHIRPSHLIAPSKKEILNIGSNHMKKIRVKQYFNEIRP